MYPDQTRATSRILAVLVLVLIVGVLTTTAAVVYVGWRGRQESVKVPPAADPLTDEKLARIDRALDEAKRVADDLAIKAARPRLAGGGGVSAPAVREHKAAFDAYVRSGDDGSLRALEQKALSVGTGTDGGYLVPDEIEALLVF